MQHNVQREDDNLQNFGRRRLFSRISHASSFTLLEADKFCMKRAINRWGESNLKRRGCTYYLAAVLAAASSDLPPRVRDRPRFPPLLQSEQYSLEFLQQQKRNMVYRISKIHKVSSQHRGCSSCDQEYATDHSLESTRKQTERTMQMHVFTGIDT